ncbi:hypothetical protein HWV54_05130 [Bartonella alsatica]|uniref:Uncharacterized protein n=2 Tax=Bartonella alsatica TaxID=52764 RepID=J1IV09_9HYPH|nr:hypothetical protein [Bartonella alsatica]EJF75407.1 hypothetical protein MEC_00883 [Bartonella alsatica IBS 382]QLC52254.1 hypothetical protein HWV54_05130 [Bartonella alsatica]
MNMKYIITAFAIFASISIAEGASFVVAQKLEQRIFSSASSNEQGNSTVSEIFQGEFSYIDNGQRRAVVKLVPVSHRGKKRDLGSRKNFKRPKFSRGPLSF